MTFWELRNGSNLTLSRTSASEPGRSSAGHLSMNPLWRSAGWQPAVSPTGSRRAWKRIETSELLGVRRLPTCGTADCQSALRRCTGSWVQCANSSGKSLPIGSADSADAETETLFQRFAWAKRLGFRKTTIQQFNNPNCEIRTLHSFWRTDGDPPNGT